MSCLLLDAQAWNPVGTQHIFSEHCWDLCGLLLLLTQSLGQETPMQIPVAEGVMSIQRYPENKNKKPKTQGLPVNKNWTSTNEWDRLHSQRVYNLGKEECKGCWGQVFSADLGLTPSERRFSEPKKADNRGKPPRRTGNMVQGLRAWNPESDWRHDLRMETFWVSFPYTCFLTCKAGVTVVFVSQIVMSACEVLRIVLCT